MLWAFASCFPSKKACWPKIFFFSACVWIKEAFPVLYKTTQELAISGWTLICVSPHAIRLRLKYKARTRHCIAFAHLKHTMVVLTTTQVERPEIKLFLDVRQFIVSVILQKLTQSRMLSPKQRLPVLSPVQVRKLQQPDSPSKNTTRKRGFIVGQFYMHKLSQEHSSETSRLYAQSWEAPNMCKAVPRFSWNMSHALKLVKTPIPTHSAE